MALPKGFRIKAGQLLMSEKSGVVWRVMVAGSRYVQLTSETVEAVVMRVPTATLREMFTQVIEVS